MVKQNSWDCRLFIIIGCDEIFRFFFRSHYAETRKPYFKGLDEDKRFEVINRKILAGYRKEDIISEVKGEWRILIGN